MGGDRAPDEILKGCWDAVPLLGGEDLIYLVGDEAVCREGLAGSGLSDADKRRFRVVPTTQVIEMDESPVDAVRTKPKASINVMCDLAKKGEADVVISAGNTGACVAAAQL
jgi:glycerol-3-phosphate acyltransferase PlsX